MNKTYNNQIKTLYRPEIDGLRAFAVITVIVNHFNKELLPGGYLGVDIFFVISGYVITSSIYKRSDENFKEFICGFYARRVKRLIPVLIFFVTVTSFAICLFNPQPIISLRTGAASLVGLSNIYLPKQSTDYFAQTTELNVFTHTWSLGVEEQFYILFPLIIWFSGFARKTKNSFRNLSLIVGFISIASLIVFLYLYPINQSAAYFLMPTRFWEMSSGCLIFLLISKQTSIKQTLEHLPPVLILLFIVLGMYLPESWGALSTILVVSLTSLLIISLREKTLLFKVFTNSKIIFIGLISYSLYLFHWGVLSISRWTIGIYWWTVPFQIIIIFALAIASYHWIETPFRRRNWFKKRWKTLVFTGGLLVSLSGFLVLMREPLEKMLYTGIKINTLEPSDYIGYETGRYAINCHTSDSGKYALKGSNFISSSFMNNCLSSKSKKPLIAFSGDSHSLTLFPLSEIVSKSGNFDVFSHSRDGCAFPPQGETNRKNCLQVQSSVTEKILGEIKARDKGSIIVAISYLNSHFGYKGEHRKQFKKFPNGSKRHVDRNLKNFIKSVKRLSIKLKQQKASLIIVAPLPQHAGYIQEISSIQWFRPKISIKDQKTSRRYLLKERNHIIRAINDLANEVDNIYIFDAFDKLCDSEYCYATKEGKFLFSDDDHLSKVGAELISKDFISLIKKINNIQN